MQIRPVISDYIRRSLLTTQGDIIIRGAAQPERYAAGADGEILTAQGVGAEPIWEAPRVVNTDRPAFSAYMNTSQPNVTGDGTFYFITGNFWTEDVDQGNNFSNGTFTAPESGIYMFSSILYIYEVQAAHTNGSFAFRLTGIDIWSLGINLANLARADSGFIISFSTIAQMSSGDTAYLGIVVVGGNCSIGVISPQTRFSGVLLC